MSTTATTTRRNSLTQVLGDITELIGDRLSTVGAVCEQHGNDLTWNKGESPDAVAFVHSTDEVAAIVRICSKYEVPVIPFGTGTSLEGHISAPFGGITIDLSEMNEVLEVNAEDLDCRVQAGVTRKQLNEYLRDTGLFFPIDPGADASIGGMTSTRASGTNAVRYGTMRENVLSVTAVMPDGEVVRTARRARKSSAGYDLTRLSGRSRRHARRDHGSQSEAARHSRSDLGRGVPVPGHQRGLSGGDHDHSDGHSGRAHRVSGRAAGEGLQRLCGSGACRDADAVSGIPRLGEQCCRTERAVRGNRRAMGRRAVCLGDQGGRADKALAGKT